MIRIHRAALMAACLSLPLAGHVSAQGRMMSHGNPVMDAVRTNLQSSAKNMVGAAKEMPADKYAYKPTDGQRTFGEIISHVAGSNNYMCSTLSGMAAPDTKVPDGAAAKDDLIAAVQASYDYCTKALADVTDAQLGDMVKYFGGRQVTRAFVAVAVSDDWADHYSQLAGYLRLNGLLPPTAQRGM
jgi:DinB superfamily